MRSGCHRPDRLRAGRTFLLPLWAVLCIIATGVCTSPLGTTQGAADERPSQYQVEAAYLFNFAKFVKWPPKPVASDSNFTICVLGDDPFGPFLDRITSGENVDGRPVVDRRISRPADAISCSILYISSSEGSRLSRILAELKNAPVLTVSDMDQFVDRGGIIQFVLRDNRIRFLVNLQPARQEGLSLSSELLKVAAGVRGTEGGR